MCKYPTNREYWRKAQLAVRADFLIMGIMDSIREDGDSLRISMAGLGLIFFICCSSLLMCSAADLPLWENRARPNPPVDAFEAAVKSFSLLSSFFNDVDARGIYPVSRHGSSYAEAYEYLLQGFDANLAGDILEAYTMSDPGGTLRIIPCEGIPMLTAADRVRATVTQHEDSAMIQVRLEDCYQTGDCYIYQITSRLIDGNWKITDLSLTEQ